MEQDTERRKVVLPGGAGHLGKLLIEHFTARGDEVVVLGRGNGTARGARHVRWDGRTVEDTWAREFDGADLVVNLAGRSVDCRYDKTTLAEMYGSRVESTRAVGRAIAGADRPPSTWLQMSTATVYAHTFGAPHDEDRYTLGGREEVLHLKEIDPLGIVAAVGGGIGHQRGDDLRYRAPVEGEHFCSSWEGEVWRGIARDEHPRPGALWNETEGERHAVGAVVEERLGVRRLVVHAHLGVAVANGRHGADEREVDRRHRDRVAIGSSKPLRIVREPVEERREGRVGVVEAESGVQRLHGLLEQGEVLGKLGMRDGGFRQVGLRRAEAAAVAEVKAVRAQMAEWEKMKR